MELARYIEKPIELDQQTITAPRLAPSERPLAIAASYPERFHVPLELRPWNRPFPNYEPAFFEHPRVIEMDRTKTPKGWADSPDVARDEFVRLKVQGKLFSHEGEVRLDVETGRPLNPWGRTGISGRGLLGRWGANQAADALMTRLNPETNKVEALLILRDCGHWAIPGGMLDDGETALEATVRELEEETDIAIGSERFKLVYQGMGDGPRTTDNAWIETTLYHVHLKSQEEYDHCNRPRPKSDAKGAKWTVLEPEVINSLYSNHSDLMGMAIAQMKYSDPETYALIANQLGALPPGHTLTSFTQMHGKIGVLGGTFDPVQDGHLEAGEVARVARELDALIYIPTQQNPLKEGQPGAEPLERFEMLGRAAHGRPDTFVSPIEIRKNHASYTIETLREICRELPADSKLHMIIGSDCLPDLSRWRDLHEICALTEIIPILRPGIAPPDWEALNLSLGEVFVNQLKNNIVTLDFEPVSSSELRETIASGKGIEHGTPACVVDYINSHHLYGAHAL